MDRVTRMSKKKPQRVNTRKAIENEIAQKRQSFYSTGAPVSLAMLAVYVVCAAIILSLGGAQGEIAWWVWLRSALMLAALLLALSLAMGLYVASCEPQIVKNHLRGLVLLAMLLFMLGLIRLVVAHQLSPYILVVPVMIAGITMTIAYSQRFALGMGSYLAIVGVVVLPESHDQLAVLLTIGSGTGMAILTLREIRSRSRLLEVCFLAGVVVFAMAWLVGLRSGTPAGESLRNSLWGAAGALLVGFLMQGLLPLVERAFRTATSMTLLEYSEATRPLLRRLAVEAPGTFNHSWQIGMIAEAAAESIGADGLLCRVGSYYHDIGKLNKPKYFVENQGEMFNQHKELSPTMSRMIITGHVKDGMELAREYHLPKVLRQFISSHHGTTLVEYFYHEASKQEGEAGRSVEESEFRYPGPKPTRREQAIVMIADAVEGATRAMQDPTPSRIGATVHSLAIKRLQDGQFDECDLTMRELHKIEESIVKSVCGMYHSRIAYPKQEEPEKLKDEKADTEATAT